MVDPSQSTLRAMMQLSMLEGDFTGVSRGHDGTTLIHMAPFSTIRQQPLISEAFAQIVAQDAELKVRVSNQDGSKVYNEAIKFELDNKIDALQDFIETLIKNGAKEIIQQ